MNDKISIDDVKKLDVRVGTIVEVERVPDTDRLYKLTVDIGEEEPRTILSAIVPFVSEEELLGKQCPFVANLEPREMRGIESNGMILACGDGETFSLLHPTKKLEPGTSVL